MIAGRRDHGTGAAPDIGAAGVRSGVAGILVGRVEVGVSHVRRVPWVRERVVCTAQVGSVRSLAGWNALTSRDGGRRVRGWPLIVAT